VKLLLDTHALLWFLDGDRQLSQAARDAILDEEADVLVSAVSGYEVAIKKAIGKLPELVGTPLQLEAAAFQQGFQFLKLSFQHARAAGELPLIHKDPWDRMLIAQAFAEDLTLVSNEELFDAYGASRLW
jgi:PIN domain nuclease of toxin-antitoxin system